MTQVPDGWAYKAAFDLWYREAGGYLLIHSKDGPYKGRYRAKGPDGALLSTAAKTVEECIHKTEHHIFMLDVLSGAIAPKPPTPTAYLLFYPERNCFLHVSEEVTVMEDIITAATQYTKETADKYAADIHGAKVVPVPEWLEAFS